MSQVKKQLLNTISMTNLLVPAALFVHALRTNLSVTLTCTLYYLTYKLFVLFHDIISYLIKNNTFTNVHLHKANQVPAVYPEVIAVDSVASCGGALPDNIF